MNSIRAELQKAKAARDHLIDEIDQAENEIAEAHRELIDYEKAQAIIQELAATLQNHAQQKIAGVVSQCLKVFGDYQFRIDFEPKRGSTAATFMLSKDGIDIDPMDSGGGHIDVIAFALRVAVLMARKPAAQPILFLDEPFKFVSANYRPIVGDLLEKLSDELDVQFVIVTHIPELMRGKVVEL